MQTLNFFICDQVIEAQCPGRLVVAQTRGHLFAQFALDQEWEGLSVTAVFSNDFARKSYQRILTADPVEVPEEVLVPGRLFVSLVGLGDGGAVRLTTKRMDKPIVVYRAGDLVGLTPEETTPELWEQAMSVIGSLDELQTSDKSSLVAAINAVLQSGGGGSVDPDAIAQAVADYMAAHPIQETDPTVPAWAKQPEKPTYTAEEVHALPDTVNPIVSADGNSQDGHLVVWDTDSSLVRDGGSFRDNLKQNIDSTLSQPGKAADAAAVGEQLSSLSGKIVTTSESKVSAHNTGTDTHSDIRLLISGLTDRLNALADSDDTTLDQLSEVVAYIKANRELIASITTDKVSVSDIIDNLTTNVSNKPLSSAQGVALKALIDAISVPDKLPNPNALTFTGAVTGSYDGSAPLSVEIPSGGGGSGGAVSWKLIRTINIVSGTSIYSFNTDNNGNAFRIKNFLILIDSYPTIGYLEIKPNGNFSFVQKPYGKQNYPFSFMMKRVTDGRYILENSNTSNSIFERTISNEYSSFGEFTSFSLWFSADPASDTTMYILGEDV